MTMKILERAIQVRNWQVQRPWGMLKDGKKATELEPRVCRVAWWTVSTWTSSICVMVGYLGLLQQNVFLFFFCGDGD
jgi:hypothetical protein